MATYNFDLLDLADGESGDAAVSVVVGKQKKTEADAANLADHAEPAAQEKQGAALRHKYFTKVQHDNGIRMCQQGIRKFKQGQLKCEQEVQRLREVLIELRGQEAKLKEQKGSEAPLKELSDKQSKLRQQQMNLRLEQSDLRQEERKLKQEEIILLQLRKDFCKEHGLFLEDLEKEKEPGNNSHGANAGSGSNSDDVSGNVCNSNGGGSDCGGNNDQDQAQVCDGGEHYSHGHDERQVERGHGHYNNGERHRQGQPRVKKVYMPKAKASSDAGTDGEVGVSASETQQKEEVANADAVPASESDKSAGGAAQDGPNNGQGVRTGNFKFVPKEKRLNGSERRKKKNAKKNNGNEPEKAKKQDSEADKQPLAVAVKEEEKKTLVEYERIREDKNKSLEASKTEVRKVIDEELQKMQKLEKKKLDDEEAVIKVEKVHPKVKEATSNNIEKIQPNEEQVQDEVKEGAAKEVKPKKVVIPRQNLGFMPPRRISYAQEDGSFARGRFNGGFQGGSRDNSIEPRVSGLGDNNGRAAQNEAGGHNGNGAPRVGVYSGQGDDAPRGGYSGPRNGYRGNGGYGRGNGVYRGNGYQPQQQGGNVGRFQQERAGNGGYYQHQGGQNQRRQYYQQRGSSGDRRSSAPAAPDEPALDMSMFPALPTPPSARSAEPASAPTPAPAAPSAPAAVSAPSSVPANA